MKSKKIQSTACLFLTSIIWGVAFVAQRAGLEYVSSFTFNGVRFALGALMLVPVTLVFERGPDNKARKKNTLLLGIIGGLVLFAAASLQQFGVEFTESAGKSGFITGLYVVIVPVMGVFLGRKANIFVWLGAVFSCAGLYLLSLRDGLLSIELGDTVLLIGALLWAVHIILIDRYAGGVCPILFSSVQFFTCSALSLICAFIFEDVRVSSILAGYVPILYAGCLSVGIAYTLQIFGQRHVEPAKAAIIFSLESLFAVLGGALILGEVMDSLGYIGCALIFAGIITSQLTRKRRKSLTEF